MRRKRFRFELTGTTTFQINTTSTNQSGIAPGVKISLTNGHLYIGAIDLSGSFTLQVSSSDLSASLNAQLVLAGLPTFSVVGGVTISSSGIAAILSLQIQNASIAAFSFSGSYKLHVNTTGVQQTIGGTILSAGHRLC